MCDNQGNPLGATGGTPDPTDQSHIPGQNIPSNKDGDQLQPPGDHPGGQDKDGERENIELPKQQGKIDARDWDSDRIRDIFEQNWSRHTQSGVNPQILTVYYHEGECLGLRLCRLCDDPLVFHSRLDTQGHLNPIWTGF